MNTIEDNPPRRWDPIVKLTHWGVVAAVVGNALLTEEGSGWHIWVGYGLAGLVGLRLLWGLVGPREARFSAFPPNPARAMAHIGEIQRGEVTRHRSHNPLGALMVYAIWATLLVIIGSGIAMAGPPPADPSAVESHEGGEREETSVGASAAETTEIAMTTPGASVALSPAQVESVEQEKREAKEESGEREEQDERAERKTSTDRDDRTGLTQANAPAPTARAQEQISASAPALYREEAGEREEAEEGGEQGEGEAGEWLEELHEIAVNLLYALIALHLLGVVFETRRSGREIVGAMLPGGNRPA